MQTPSKGLQQSVPRQLRAAYRVALHRVAYGSCEDRGMKIRVWHSRIWYGIVGNIMVLYSIYGVGIVWYGIAALPWGPSFFLRI